MLINLVASVNSEFTNFSGKIMKNVYLSYSIINCEDVLYSEVIDFSKNSIDCFGVNKIDGCSYNIDCEGQITIPILLYNRKFLY
jgi:hypothetical protein